MIIWMISSFPFKDKLICFSHIISEFGFFLYTSALFAFLSQSMPTNSRSNLGSVILWGLIGLIVIIWLIFFIHIIKVCIYKYKMKKDEALAKEIEEEEKENEEREKIEEERAVICQKRKRQVVRIINEQKGENVLNIIYIYIIIYI